MRLRTAVLALLPLVTPAAAADTQGMVLYTDGRANDFPKLIRLCNQALLEQDVPDTLRSGVLRVRAAAEMHLELFDAAVEDYDRAIAVLVPVLDANPQFKPFLPDMLLERGIAEYYDGKYEAAVADFTAVLAERPTDGDALAERGGAYAKLGKRAEAIADLDAALAIDPKNEDAIKWRAELQ